MKSLVILSSLLVAISLQAQSISKEHKERLSQDMNYIGQIFQNFYAPKAWKESHVGWSLPQELQKAQSKIQNANTVKEYRSAVTDFLKSTADYHVGFNFYSTEVATLPFQVKTVQGKTIFVFIDRKKLPVATFPFQVGDELLAMDQVPMAQVLNEIKIANGKNVAETDNAMADLTVASRSGRRNNVVPNSVVTLTIQRKQESKPVEQQIAWEYTPETIIGETMSSDIDEEQPQLKSPMMISSVAQELAQYQMAANNFGVGVRESFLPDFGARIWESEATSPFDAYIYKNEEGKLIGVVRISKYYEPDHSAASAAFVKIIAKFQKVTDSMVIDQLNNPGGSVFYLYGLASMLTETAIATPKHRMVLNYADISEAQQYLTLLNGVKNDEDAIKAFQGATEIHGYPVNFQLAMALRNQSRFIIAQWNAGKKLTDPYYLSGVDKINPHPVARYSKPIVVLVNELDFSGGDFFPAILQDNKRVTVVGNRTAGAGGYVGSLSFPNSFGLSSISYTGSLAERVDKNPIENLGVTPDIKLEMTLDDYRNNFSNYLKEVKAIVKKLTP